MPAGTARVALRQLAPKPLRSSASRRCRRSTRFLKATGDAELVWLADGIDTGRGSEFLAGLAKALGERS